MWARILNAALGVWLMATPAVLAYTAPAATNDRIVGPVAASCAIIAIWEATRPMRHVNMVLGAWLLVAPWVLGYGSIATINSIAVGVLMVALSRVRGRLTNQFDGGWTAVATGYAEAVERREASRHET